MVSAKTNVMDSVVSTFLSPNIDEINRFQISRRKYASMNMTMVNRKRSEIDVMINPSIGTPFALSERKKSISPGKLRGHSTFVRLLLFLRAASWAK